MRGCARSRAATTASGSCTGSTSRTSTACSFRWPLRTRRSTWSFALPDDWPGWPKLEPYILPLKTTAPVCPLTDGTEIFRVFSAARASLDTGVGDAHSYEMYLAFGDGLAVSGKPISSTLAELLRDVEDAVAPLFGFLE